MIHAVELDFYSLGLRDLARELDVNETHLLWLIRTDRMQEDADFFKVIRIGKSTHKRYRGKCYEVLRAKLTGVNLNELWRIGKWRLRDGYARQNDSQPKLS
jgi:hypothetical protein